MQIPPAMAVLILVAMACAVPGVFLVLRRNALVSDAIGHVLILGIVLAYFITRDIESPWLLVGAALAGVLTVALVEALQNTKLVRSDAAIGLVFPALFAIGVLLVSLYVPNVHIDVDAVLVGQPENADLPRWRAVRAELDAVWYLETPSEVRIPRLITRHVKFGRDAAAATAWALGSDQTNAQFIESRRGAADLIVTLTE